MSVGNYLGGIVADRRASPRMLGIIFLAGSVSCLLILVTTDLVAALTLSDDFAPVDQLLARLLIERGN